MGRTHGVTPRVRNQRSTRIAHGLKQAVSTGTYLSGEHLPPLKLLCRELNANYRTIRKALDTLIEDSVLERRGRGHIVATAPSRHRTANATLLLAAGAHGQLHLVSARTQDHIRLLETECARMGLRLVCITPDQLRSPHLLRATLARIRDVQPLGLIAWRAGIIPAVFDQCLIALDCLPLPLAVLDETGEQPYRAPPVWRRRAAVVHMGVSAADGAAMGRFLRSLGHRRAAFVSANHQPSRGHSHARFTGMREEFARAGYGPESVELFALLDTGEQASNALSVASMAGAAAVAVAGMASTLGTDDLSGLAYSARQLQEFARSSTGEFATRRGIPRLCREALQRADVTVLVGDNDATALACLDYLEEHRVAVPGTISVAGFDDGLAALMRNLTSFNFNGGAAIRALLAHVLGHCAGGRGPVFAVDGHVVERSTTAGVTVRAGR